MGRLVNSFFKGHLTKGDFYLPLIKDLKIIGGLVNMAPGLLWQDGLFSC